MKEKYADIIVDITHSQIDRTFQYRIPEALRGQIHIGDKVLVPFGNGNRRISGYVVGLSDTPFCEESRLKDIAGTAPGGVEVEAKLLPLAGWIRENYGSTMIQALKTILPVKQKMRAVEKRTLRFLLTPEQASEQEELYRRKNQKARLRLLLLLKERQEVSYTEATGEHKISRDAIRALQEQGVLEVCSRQVWRNPFAGVPVEKESAPLTAEQQEAVGQIFEEWEHRRRPCLIHGVTGSGKTRVYMELIGRILEEGKQAIVLIPEIALTYQTVLRFYRRFGDQVSVLHSQLSQGERFDQFERAKRGEIRVMIGPRSALFTPFPDLGLIIMDEEHENSYQSENTPRYHARETAQERAKLENALFVMGSATPSVEAYFRSTQGEYRLVSLTHRYGNARLPAVHVTDMREELKSGNRSILSMYLQEAIAQRLERGEQTVLFLNRRGYAGFISCRSCGTVLKCPHCDVSLTSHENGRLVCHYCGYETRQVQTCPVCHSPYIGGFRAGTQQIEKIVKTMYPKARILRMDLDTTQRKGAYEQILKQFAGHEADILIGTQMIVKGHDFPHVTLVGVLAADLSLFADDYRASERTFQLLTQAVGRAGRAELPGEAVIQTYQPEHYSIQTAAAQDYEAFYEEEISYRKLMGYPPAQNLLAVHAACSDEELLARAMDYIRKFLVRANRSGTLSMLGPAAESVSKVRDMYRMVLYLKEKDYRVLVALKDKLEKYIEINSGFKEIYIQFEFRYGQRK